MSASTLTLIKPTSPSSLRSSRGAVGPVPDLVPLLQLPGRVSAEGDRLPGTSPAGPVRRLCPGVLLGLQGQLAPRAGLPGEQPAHHLLPPRGEQVRPLTRSHPSCCFCLWSMSLFNEKLLISRTLNSVSVYPSRELASAKLAKRSLAEAKCGCHHLSVAGPASFR